MTTKEERRELWRMTLETYKKAKEEYGNTDPSSDEYMRVTNNLKEISEKIIKMAQEDRQMKWDIIKFGISSGLGILQTVGTFAFGTVMLDWEQANSMRSKFWPIVQQFIPKSIRRTGID